MNVRLDSSRSASQLPPSSTTEPTVQAGDSIRLDPDFRSRGIPFHSAVLISRIDGGQWRRSDPLLHNEIPGTWFTEIAVPLDAKKLVEYRYELRDDAPKVTYNSRTFAVRVEPHVSELTFDATWQERNIGGFTGGTKVRIDYDRQRLSSILASASNNKILAPEDVSVTDVSVWVKFPSEPPRVFSLGNGYGPLLQPLVDIPVFARGMNIWFEAKFTACGKEGTVYDSNFGRDYHFDIGSIRSPGRRPPEWEV